MKLRRNTALLLAVVLVAASLSGCAAMLEREYVSVTEHNQFFQGGADPFLLRAETYQGLVNALLYLVSQGTAEGRIRLVNYTRDVEADLSSACLLVATEDPLGAYAVDYIKYSGSRIVSYYEAAVQISYRRTPEQIKGVVRVTGSGAIKEELRDALVDFSPECVLRVSYYTEDENYIRKLFHTVYYDTPEAAFGAPDVEVALYPAAGQQRLVEVLFTYPEERGELRRKQNALLERADDLLGQVSRSAQTDMAAALSDLVAATAVYDPAGDSTAYGALVEGAADSCGLSLAMRLLCARSEADCMVVEGTRGGEPHFWNLVFTDGLWWHVDASTDLEGPKLDGDMAALGYTWEAEDYPPAVAPAAEEENL